MTGKQKPETKPHEPQAPAPNGALTAGDITSLELEVVRVPLPDKPGGKDHCFVRQWTALERDTFELNNVNSRLTGKPYNIRGQVLAFSLCDENGKRLFSDEAVEDVGQVAIRGLQPAYDVAARINRLDDDSQAKVLADLGLGQEGDSL